MKTPSKHFHRLRLILRPWWAKVVALIVLLAICIGLYATYVYVGYQRELRAYRNLTMNQRATLGDFNDYNNTTHITPDWVGDYLPSVHEYGKRLTGIRLMSDGNYNFENLKHFYYLKNLELQGNNNTPFHHKITEELPLYLPEVEQIFVQSSRCFNTPGLAKAIALHKSPKRLTIHLAENNATTEIAALGELAKSSSIYRLDLYNPNTNSSLNNMDSVLIVADSSHLNEVQRFTSLKRLAIQLNHITEDDIKILNSMPHLEKIDIGIKDTTQSDIKNLSKLKPAIHKLSLGKILDDIDETKNKTIKVDLKPLTRQTSIESLTIPKDSFKNLNALLKVSRNLKYLDIQHSYDYPTKDFSYLSALKNTKIQWLSINGKIDPYDGLPEHFVTDITALDDLTMLWLVQLNITKEDFDKITSAITLKWQDQDPDAKLLGNFAQKFIFIQGKKPFYQTD